MGHKPCHAKVPKFPLLGCWGRGRLAWAVATLTYYGETLPRKWVQRLLNIHPRVSAWHCQQLLQGR